MSPVPTLFEHLYDAYVACARSQRSFDEDCEDPWIYLDYPVQGDFLMAHGLFEAERRGLVGTDTDEAAAWARVQQALLDCDHSFRAGPSVRAAIEALGLDPADRSPPTRRARPRLVLEPGVEHYLGRPECHDRSFARVNIFRILHEPGTAPSVGELCGYWTPWEYEAPFEIPRADFVVRYERCQRWQDERGWGDCDPAFSEPADELLSLFDAQTVRFFGESPAGDNRPETDANEGGRFANHHLLVTDGVRLARGGGWLWEWRPDSGWQDVDWEGWWGP